jgi:hypothetical protein
VSPIRPHRGFSRGPDAIPGQAFDIVTDGDGEGLPSEK